MTTAGGKLGTGGGGEGGGRTLESARVPGWSGDRKWDGGRQVRSPVVRGKGELRELLENSKREKTAGRENSKSTEVRTRYGNLHITRKIAAAERRHGQHLNPPLLHQNGGLSKALPRP